LATTDTVIVHKTDTIYSRITDTIRVIAYKINPVMPAVKEYNTAERPLAVIKSPSDCEKELCPDEAEAINELSMKGSFSNDSMYREFTVSLR
jgi:hypothetical protein